MWKNPTANDQPLLTRRAFEGIGSFVDKLIPVGFETTWPATEAKLPSMWHAEDGSAISRTLYSELFALIGTTYGAGDLSTTFNLPDMRGRVAVGLDNMGGVAANRIATATVLGGTGGAETTTLTAAQSGLPSHTHPLPTTTVAAGIDVVAVSPGGAGSTTTGFTGGSAATSGHTNLQPYMAKNWIIRIL